jgi:hypothetical protein
MIRRVFTILATGSILMALVTAALWVRSYGGSGDEFGFSPADRSHQHWVWLSRPEDRTSMTRAFPRFDYIEKWSRESDLFVHGDRTPILESRTWVVPYWSLVAATGWVPAIALFRRWGRSRRRRQWAAANCCRACGYDLRATPSFCPECGAASS